MAVSTVMREYTKLSIRLSAIMTYILCNGLSVGPGGRMGAFSAAAGKLLRLLSFVGRGRYARMTVRDAKVC